MPRLFDGVDDEIRLLGPTTSPLVGFDMGPSSVAIVFKPVAIPDSADTVFGVYDDGSGTFTEELRMNTPAGYGVHNGTTGHGYGSIISTTFGWYLMIVTKAGGSSVTRFHRYEYQDNSWFHGDGLALADSVFPIATRPAGVIGGNSSRHSNIHVAAIGVWQRVLSDAECELMPLQATTWLTLPNGAPSAMWTFSQAAVTDPIIDLTGNGFNQSARTGTALSDLISPINEGVYQYLSPTAISRTATVGEPAVSTELVEATPDEIVRTPTVGEPTVDLGPVAQDLAPSLIVRTPTVGSPASSLGPPTQYRLSVPTIRTPIDRSSMPWRFWAIDVAQTLVKDDGTWRLVRSPRDDLLQEFEGAYRGGYVHTVDALTAIELVRDGFGDALEPI